MLSCHSVSSVKSFDAWWILWWWWWWWCSCLVASLCLIWTFAMLHCTVFIHSHKRLFLEARWKHDNPVSISTWRHDPPGRILKALCGIPFSVYKVQEEERLTFISFFCCLEVWSHTLKIDERGVDQPNTLEEAVKYLYFLNGGQVEYFHLIGQFF